MAQEQPQHPNPQPVRRPGDELEFEATTQKPSWQQRLREPSTLVGIALGLAVVALIVWLERNAADTHRPAPKISYELLRNDGRTEGVPIAIKMNHLTLFVIDDPMSSGGGAERAKQIVESIESTVAELREKPGRNIILEYDSQGLPKIVQQMPDGTERRTVIQLTAGDVAQAGNDNSKLLSRVWAERLTDALKLYIFGEEPEFTKETDFGDALMTMYLKALEMHGAISGKSLDDAFDDLTDEQKMTLQTFPIDKLPKDESASSAGANT